MIMMVMEVMSKYLGQIPPTLQWPVVYCVASTAALFILSVVTGNVSQVDRVWTFLPAIYTAYFALMPLWPGEPPLPLFPYTPKEVSSHVASQFSPRALLMLALVTLWMVRLSYNTWRRGLFSFKEEDYRWAVLRQRIPSWLFPVFNLTFIAATQNIILLLLGIPAYYAVHQAHTPLIISDLVLAALALLTLVLEFAADNQQYSFQTYKHTGARVKDDWFGARIHWTPADAKRGFVTRGLWAWSRHPNFFCEQMFWVIITLFPLMAPDSPALPTLPLTSAAPFYPLAPALVLCTLFFSSTLFSESISLGKYPVPYAAYQQRVAMFVPLLTPLWGLILLVKGKKQEVDRLVYGGEDEKIGKAE